MCRAWRFYIFEHYRGLTIPYDDPELHAYKSWYDHVFSLEAVKRTLPDKSRYLEHIGKYADSRYVCVFALNYHFNTSFYMYLPDYSIASESARSKVANAVRRGVAAHEIDDVKDTY